MLLLLFQQATGAYAVTADVGVYALAGQGAGLITIRIMPSDAGVYALDGQDATLSRGRTLVSDAAAYALAGRDASLLSARRVSSDVGAYALSGQDAGLVYSGTATLEPMAPVYVPRDRRSWSAGYGPIAFEATSTLLWVVPRARHTTTEDQ